MSTWSSARSSRLVKRTSSSIKALIHFAERGSQSLPDSARMIAEVARTSFPLPSWLIWRLGEWGHAGDAAGRLDDGDLKAVRLQRDPVGLPAAADSQQFGNDAVHAEASFARVTVQTPMAV